MNRLLLAGLLLAAPAVAVEAPPSLTYSRTISSTISSAVDIPATAAASPLSLKQLRTLYADVVKPIEPTRQWFKKPLAARLGAERDAEALVQRIEKTFGDAPDSPAAACRSAAIQQRMYVGVMNNMVALAEGHGQRHHRPAERPRHRRGLWPGQRRLPPLPGKPAAGRQDARGAREEVKARLAGSA